MGTTSELQNQRGLAPWRPKQAMHMERRPSFPGAATLVYGLILWLSFVRTPEPTPPEHLDGAWLWAMTRSTVDGLRWGTEVGLPYGPLGRLHVVGFLPEVYWTHLVTGWVAAAAFAGALLRFGRRLPSTTHRFLYAIVILLIEPHARLVGVAMAVTITAAESSRRRDWVACLIALATLSLIKTTFLVIAILCVAALAWVIIRRQSWQLAAGVVAAFAATVCLVWILAGQRPQDLIAFLRVSAELIRGHNQAMGVEECEISQIAESLIVLVGAVLLAILGSLASDRRGRFGLIALAASIAFVLWKYGFVRADQHRFAFYEGVMAVMLVSGLPPISRPLLRRASQVLFIGLVALTFSLHLRLGEAYAPGERQLLTRWARMVAHNLLVLVDPEGNRQALDQEYRRTLDEGSRAVIDDMIGDATVGLVPGPVGWQHIARHRYRPPPVLAGFFTYTPALQDVNRRFFASSAAPEFLLHKWSDSDARYPSLEGSGSVVAMFQHYRPVASGDSWVLTRRRRAGQPRAVNTVEDALWQRWMETHAEASDFVWATIEFEPKVLETMRALAYKSRIVEIEVRLDDGSTMVRRIIPSMTQRPFLLSPLFAEGAPGRWARGETGPTVTAFRLLQREGPSVDHGPTSRVTLRRWPGALSTWRIGPEPEGPLRAMIGRHP